MRLPLDQMEHAASPRVSESASDGNAIMLLTGELLDIPITLICPACKQHGLTKKGIWFKFARHFDCQRCESRTQITYDMKQKLFENHARLLEDDRAAAKRESSASPRRR